MRYPVQIQAFLGALERRATEVRAPRPDPEAVDNVTKTQLAGGVYEGEVGGPVWLLYDRCTFSPDGRLVSRSVSARKQDQGTRLLG